jgi:hypothetical protein
MGRNWPDEDLKLSIFDSVYFSHVGSSNVDLFASANTRQIGRSSDHGFTWTIFEIPVFPEVSLKDAYPTVIAVSQKSISNQYDPRNYFIYAGTRAHAILRSADNGLTWNRLTALPATGKIVSLATGRTSATRTALFAGTEAGELWNSVDGGESWSPVGMGALVSRTGRAAVYAALSPAFAQDGLMLAGTNAGLFLSRDRGDSWRPVSFGAFVGESFVVEQIEFPPDFVQSREALVRIRGKGLYKFNIAANGRTSGAVNIGGSLIKEGIQFTEFHSSPNIAQDGVIVGVAGHSIWRTSNRGVDWQRANPVVPSP